ncbi:MAG: class I SAM-dependent methyltransferase [Spirochaetes bacterium]|nr:class I SAM-dependent methyltransferase [Spirochaetota bacterium]
METQTSKFNKETGKNFDTIAKTIFAPVYPVIADQIVERTGIDKGICIDLGSGPGHLGIAIAKLYKFKVYGVDFSAEINDIAVQNIKSEGVDQQLKLIPGSADDMPFNNNFADLIISRGSLFFWQDVEKAFNEIYRVLKPGGKTYIGGGFGSDELREQVTVEMRKIDPDWECHGKKQLGKDNTEHARSVLDNLNIDYHLFDDETGLWFMIKK